MTSWLATMNEIRQGRRPWIGQPEIRPLVELGLVAVSGQANGQSAVMGTRERERFAGAVVAYEILARAGVVPGYHAAPLARREPVFTPHVCPADGVVREWDDLIPGWDRDNYGLAGAHCPACGTTLCREAKS